MFETQYTSNEGTGGSQMMDALHMDYATTNYSYDSAGNMTSDGTNTWAYDARNRMASDTVSSLATNYGINALGQRITKSGAGIAGGGPNEYVYDEKGRLLGEYDSTGTVINETVWLGKLPVAVLTGTGALGATYYINPDHLGAPHVITDVSGNPVWTWDHLAFGDSEPNQNPSSLGVFNYNVRFPGQYSDVESGLNYNINRDYNPVFGRYVESDPIGLSGTAPGTLSTCQYAAGNPVSMADAFGLDPGHTNGPAPDLFGPSTVILGGLLASSAEDTSSSTDLNGNVVVADAGPLNPYSEPGMANPIPSFASTVKAISGQPYNITYGAAKAADPLNGINPDGTVSPEVLQQQLQNAPSLNNTSFGLDSPASNK